MKKRMLTLIALALTAAICFTGCGNTPAGSDADKSEQQSADADNASGETKSNADEENADEPDDADASDDPSGEGDTAAEPADEGDASDDPSGTDVSSKEAETSEETEVVSVAELNYSNVNYDFTEQIAAEREALALVPKEAQIPVSIADAKGATGVQLVASLEEGNTSDYYLNALVAGNELQLTAAEGAEIAAVSSSISGEIALTDKSASFVPAPIQAAAPVDEVITVTMSDQTEYKIHTVNESMPGMVITGSGVDAANAGVYDFAIDKFLLRVNTAGELVYYRNLGCVGELMAENFAKQETADGSFFSYFVELHAEFRNANGGYSSGMYVVMDENYSEIDFVTLLPNTEANHTHGEGYLDQHEFVILGANHYLTLSYTPELVENLPENVKGLDGGSSAYVWAGVFQEIKDGEVLHEINTTDYPLLYESAVEKLDYANSTDQGVEVTINDNAVPSLADGWMDYVHPNSLDYTLGENGETKKLLVSMRDQCAVYQFDLPTGGIDWILGGKASTLSGYEEFTTEREDEMGNKFTALTYGQHFARYTNRAEDGTLNENPQISIFDNQTGIGPFLTALPVPTLTRTLKATIDESAKTVAVSDVILATDMNAKTGTYHIASHCGSVQYLNEHSVVTGWGLHGVIDNIGAMAPAGTISDEGFEDLRAGSRPVFTEYDMANDAVTFELSVIRNEHFQGHEALFSYRTYKSFD